MPENFRHDSNYGELLKLLRGHPLSLEVVLPLLKKKSPSEIIMALQNEVNELGGRIEDASLSLAFSQLSPTTKKHLPFLGLFTPRVSPQILEIFVGNEGMSKAIYKKVIGETLSLDGWKSVLEEASINGLVESKDGGYYELHPTLPPFFRKQLISNFGDNGLKTLKAEFVNFYSALSSYLLEGLQKSEPYANILLAVEEPNILRALRSAEIDEDWDSIDSISRGILQFYEHSGRIAESNTLRMHLLGQIGLELTLDDSREKASSWMFLLGEEAIYCISINELEKAETLYTQILNYLISMNYPKADHNIAVSYHQLGRVAEERQKFDEAEQWYRKPLVIYERLGFGQNAADAHHQLKIIAAERKHLSNTQRP